jgi:hypothetical protein
MKIILYSCDNDGKEVYDSYEKKYREMGYVVLNPYNDKLWQGDAYSTVMRYIDRVDMLVVISRVMKSSDLISLRRYCYNNTILFRQEHGEYTMHHSWWYGNNDKKKYKI